MKKTASIERITPAQATAILNANTGNRPIRDTRVTEMARAIKEDRWKLTNDAITMTGGSYEKPGRLLNGQHRLFACIETNTPIEVLVLFGADEDSYAVMDTGAKRVASDLLPRPHQNQRRGATMLVYCYEHQALSCTAYNVSPGNDEILKTYEDHPAIGLTVDQHLQALKVLTTAQSGVLGAFALLREHDRANADTFIESVLTGHQLEKDAPELTLRNRLIAESTRGGRSRSRTPTAATYAAMVIKTWNARQTKAPLTRLIFKDGDPFPRLVDMAKQPPRVIRRIASK